MPWGMFEDLRCITWKREDLSCRPMGVYGSRDCYLKTGTDLLHVAGAQTKTNRSIISKHFHLVWGRPSSQLSLSNNVMSCLRKEWAVHHCTKPENHPSRMLFRQWARPGGWSTSEIAEVLWGYHDQPESSLCSPIFLSISVLCTALSHSVMSDSFLFFFFL